jgi:alkylhydroperoxidase family enzyme
VNDAPATVTQEDVDAAHDAGLTDEALYDAVTVCALFNFYNRWIDGTGVPADPGNHYEQRLARHGDSGYAP